MRDEWLFILKESEMSARFQAVKAAMVFLGVAVGFFLGMSFAAMQVANGHAKFFEDKGGLALFVAAVFLLVCLFYHPELDEAARESVETRWASTGLDKIRNFLR